MINATVTSVHCSPTPIETYLDSFSFRRSVLSDAAGVLLHGRGRRHPVEQLPLPPVLLDDVTTGLRQVIKAHSRAQFE